MSESVESEPFALRIQRRFEATPEALYRCFTEAEHMGRWFGPKGVRCRDVRVDARVGGQYHVEMVNSDESTIRLEGEFRELESGALIRMTWRWLRETESEPGEETLVTIRFSPIGTGTLMKLTHERFSEKDERDRHDGGWSSSLDCLDELLTTEGNRP